MDEENQLHPQASAADLSENLEPLESEPMSAETNLPTDSLPTDSLPTDNQPDVQSVPIDGVTDAAVEEEFTLDPETDGQPLGADPAVSSAEQAELKARLKELVLMIDTLKSQLDERNNQLDERNAMYARLAADFDNYRRRTQKEKEETEVQVKCATISELLQVVDNFERARSQIKPQGESELAIHKSYQGIYKQLVDSLKRIGVSPMRAEGQEFDPNLHEAVMREPTSEHPEGSVMEELVRGYVLGDRVLRHALVKVAAAPEDASE